ncbi:hypothetical protein Aperf_G00000032478 [Anoplocephala perfoliata]
MYTAKEHQSYEMEQQQPQQQHQPQQQQHVSPQGDASEDPMEAATPNDDTNGVGGSLGSLGGPRMAAGDMLYDGHSSLSAVPVSTLTAAQAAAVQQQQAMAAAANYRYMTLNSHQQMANHPQVIPATEYVYTSGPVGNHIMSSSQPLFQASHAQPLIYTTTTAASQHPQVQQPYDRCPAICSLFAIFCCPITCWCSLPALAYSLCAYTDYRANDMHEYRSKSDVARRCVIIACIIGLILCIIWAILTFLYYGEMLLLLGDLIKTVQRHLWPNN